MVIKQYTSLLDNTECQIIRLKEIVFQVVFEEEGTKGGSY